MKYDKINSQLFVKNRARFIENIEEGSLAIFHSNDVMPRNADNFHAFRQNSDFFYLTGIDQEESILLLFPGAPLNSWKEILFIKKTNDHIKVWEGEKYTMEDAFETSGIKEIKWLEDFDSTVEMLMNHAERVYINLNEHDRYSSDVEYRNLRKAKELRDKYPAHEYKRAAGILAYLRSIKQPEEIQLLTTACEITAKGFNRVLDFVKPGVWEYEIEAEISHEFLRNKATGFAYHPIIASGSNANILHYVENNKQCKDGDIILFDFGAEYANYCADLSRSIPVNGKYTQRQKDVYNAVLHVLKEATNLLRPGTLIDDYHREVGKIMEEQLISLGLLKSEDVKNQNPKSPLYKKYFMHGTSHFLGLDTHDVGHRYRPLEANMVLTCEPGIYIPEEGFGIRLENDILVTENVPVDLMEKIPVEVEEIEELMNS